MKKELDFSNLFSPAWQEFQDRKNKIRERTKCFKTCSKCGETKIIFKFSIDRRNTDGRINICKVCRSKEALTYYYQNRDRLLVKIKEYQEGKDRSKYFQDYKKEHKEHLQKVAHKWYRKNRKRIRKRYLES